MKYLSFLTKLKKAQYFFLVAVIMLGFANEISARCVICMYASGRTACFFSKRSCAEVYDSHYQGNPSCGDYIIANQSSAYLNREKGGTASITNQGKTIQIASDKLESFLDSKVKEANANIQRGTSKEMIAEKFRKELESFLKTDRGFVSEKSLIEISKELGIPIKK